MATSLKPDLPRARRHSAGTPRVDTLQVRRILCPIDFSDFSRGTAGQAAALARAFNAELQALFVFPLALQGGSGAAGVDAVDPGVRSTVAQDLVHLFGPARMSGVPVEVSLRAGDPVAEILAAADDGPADLIVMGSHGRSGVKRWALGTVADHVLRDAPCPVVTCVPSGVGPAAVGTDGPGILCAVDLSDSSPATIEYALALAGALAVPLTVLHVVPAGGEVACGLAYAKRVADARERLQQMLPEQTSVHVEMAIVTGTPYREILRIADDQHARLVVVGNRGRHTPGRTLFGSTADHVARGAACPVLTVPARV